MKKNLWILFAGLFVFSACQKSVEMSNESQGTEGTTGSDSSFALTDTLTYEVLTADTSGWFGIWNDEYGELCGNVLDNVTWGSPVYFKSGWKYSFLAKKQPFQMFVSAAARTFSEDITINFYRNGKLVSTATNSAMKGVSKLMLDAITDTIAGNSSRPMLTYEVLLKNLNNNAFQPDAWSGQWRMANTRYNSLSNPLLITFGIPSGWTYNFQPASLPFTMQMQAWPYSPSGSELTINFYVNGAMVKTLSSSETIYDMQYTVQ